LAEYIQIHQPGLRGFSAQNIWRMRQLEALDRDHRKPHENPSIGVLLCASKDLIRNMSQLKRHTRKDAGIQCQGW
jgi:hypothetical protein